MSNEWLVRGLPYNVDDLISQDSKLSFNFKIWLSVYVSSETERLHDYVTWYPPIWPCAVSLVFGTPIHSTSPAVPFKGLDPVMVGVKVGTGGQSQKSGCQHSDDDGDNGDNDSDDGDNGDNNDDDDDDGDNGDDDDDDDGDNVVALWSSGRHLASGSGGPGSSPGCAGRRWVLGKGSLHAFSHPTHV